MAGFRKRIFNRILRRPAVKENVDGELGTTRLADGTILERCVWVDGQALAGLTNGRNHPRLFIHWSTTEPDCIHDLPDLRELHLFWAHHVDFLAICWDQTTTEVSPSKTATAVDAWHRDYGLTWRSLIPDRSAGDPTALFALADDTLPQVILYDAEENLLFHRVGPLDDHDRARLALLLREKCSGSPD